MGGRSSSSNLGTGGRDFLSRDAEAYLQNPQISARWSSAYTDEVRDYIARTILPDEVRRPSVDNVARAAEAAGLERVDSSTLSESDIGKVFVLTRPIMTGPLSNRRDPDSVRFVSAVFIGFTSGTPKTPLFRIESAGNQVVRLEDFMPYESAYRRR